MINPTYVLHRSRGLNQKSEAYLAWRRLGYDVVECQKSVQVPVAKGRFYQTEEPAFPSRPHQTADQIFSCSSKRRVSHKAIDAKFKYLVTGSLSKMSYILRL
jgi:hypothetical protein